MQRGYDRLSSLKATPMRECKSGPTWREVLSDVPELDALGPDFLVRYGSRLWSPADPDRSAAHLFRVELLSRVATQRLGYGKGVEASALASVHRLFETARDVMRNCPGATTAEILIWHVMNVHVRPFTAKWHSQDEAGLLHALDAGDEFRAELERVQDAMRALDAALRIVLGSDGYESIDAHGLDAATLEAELERSVAWRPMGVPVATVPTDPMALGEADAVRARQSRHGIAPRDWAAGIALSGGGIRSATFAIGVLGALAKRNLLAQFDYLSTVSGGGYAGAFLTQIVASPDPDVGLRRDQEPFRRREGESAVLKSLRQRARYLSGAFWERVTLGLRQAHGLLVNVLLLLIATGWLAYVESLVRPLVPMQWAAILAVALPISAVAAFGLFGRQMEAVGSEPSWRLIALGALFLAPPLWYLLGVTHSAWDGLAHLVFPGADAHREFPVLAALAVVSALAVATSLVAAFTRLRRVTVAVMTGLVALFAENAMYSWFAGMTIGRGAATLLGLTAAAMILAGFIDVNLTSLHRFYRAKLAAAFLVTRDGLSATPLKLSIIDTSRSPFPILNCALNVPGSRSPAMRGRLSDVFSFTPLATGARLVGHMPTRDWERANPDLDLATAMALSGAAASPQMGLRTTRLGSFWLTLLNVRLGAWLKRPTTEGSARPRLPYLLREFAASADETLPFLHVSDGGHIENLGVYELLRRRCRFIVAVDGENDSLMTFHALTNLQRLVYIDFGIVLEIDLDDLRLGEKGLSRSHFRLCRVRYPRGEGAGQEEIGYLVYLKLSLTGNEGEFIRRYRLDEPAFPHHSTADQFFTEAQYEAYRALGEHVGEKLFLTPIVGQAGGSEDVDLSRWMKALGRALL